MVDMTCCVCHQRDSVRAIRIHAMRILLLMDLATCVALDSDPIPLVLLM
jgi:hypothetical protein